MANPDQGSAGSQRRYQSPARDQRARETRARISEAALSLFLDQGFAEVTVRSIAAHAGVSVPTVYTTFGTKGAIAGALLTRMGHEANNADWEQRISIAPDPYAKLSTYAILATGSFSFNKGIIKVVAGATGEPAISESVKENDRQRRNGLQTVIEDLERTHALQEGLSQERALDRAWILTGAELYLSATDDCEWTDFEYEQWLKASLHQQLLKNEKPSGFTPFGGHQLDGFKGRGDVAFEGYRVGHPE